MVLAFDSIMWAPESSCQPMQEPDPPLYEAAKAGDADKVTSLLTDGADPCQADSRGKVPYDVAADKSVRDAFRRSVDLDAIILLFSC